MRRTPPAPRPARWRWVSVRMCCRRACAAFPGSRIAWSRSAAAARCCSSTIPRAPTPMLGGITGLAEFFPRIRKAYLIGEAAAEFAETLGENVPHEISETLDVAVDHAARDAEASVLTDPVVLLSPACASFDQYRNFEIRGARFRDLVQALPGVKPVV